MENVSSEQELLAMREEGKISEEEYKQLRDAMNATSSEVSEKPEPAGDKAKSKRKLGVTSFCLMLAGFVLPVILFLLTILFLRIIFIFGIAPKWDQVYYVVPWVLLAIVLEIAAFATGIAAWPDGFGKATVISLSILGVLTLLFIGMFTTHTVRVG